MSIEETYRVNGKLAIEPGETHSYRELCSILDEPRRDGGSTRNSQKRNWRRFFDWENLTSQRYKITQVFNPPKEKVDGRANNGGMRKGAGRPFKMQQEFDLLLKTFLYERQQREDIGGEERLFAYFSNTDASNHFGLHAKGLRYAGDEFAQLLESQNLDEMKVLESLGEFEEALSKIEQKLSEKRRSLIIDKIRKIEGITLVEGIAAYRDADKRTVEYHDEWLGKWIGYQEEYLKKQKIGHLGVVIERKKWDQMIRYITEALCNDGCTCYERYYRIEKLHKVEFTPSVLLGFEGENGEQRQEFNGGVVEDLKSFFSKENGYASIYGYIIDRHVKV